MKSIRHCSIVVVLACVLSNGCGPRPSGPRGLKVSLNVMKPATEPSTIPIRVGVLFRDMRPDSEKITHNTLLPQLHSLIITPFFMSYKLKGTYLHALAKTPHLVNAALRIIRMNKIFESVHLLSFPEWDLAKLPTLSQRTGLRYFLGMEVRHFYMMHHGESGGSAVAIPAPGGAISNTNAKSQYHSKSTFFFEATVMRFRLYEIQGNHVHLFWQFSTRASKGLATLPEDAGSDTAQDSLDQLSRGLRALVEEYNHKARHVEIQ